MKTLVKCALVYATLLLSVYGLPQLLFANLKNIRLIDANKTRSNSTAVISHLESAAAVDFYYAEQLVFWTDISLEMIKMTQISNSSVEVSVISTDIISPEGLACDWLTKKIYWTDADTNRIEVSNFDGTHRKVLIWQGFDQPRSIALSPMDGLMFWTDWGVVPRIERASMDGNNSSRIVLVNQSVAWPNGVAVDYESKRIYWTDGRLQQISSVDFNGANRKLVVDKLDQPFALTIFKNVIYWTDLHSRFINMYNQSSNVSELLLSGRSPMGIHVYAAERQPFKKTPCYTNNGGCSHLCLLTPQKPFYSCACPTGIRLKNSTTCYDDVQQMLLLARRTDIRRISLDTPDFTDVVLPIQDVKHAIAIDFDPVENYVYWSDEDVMKIKRAFLNGSNQEDLVVTDVSNPHGLAVDWIARNLYWTDTGTDRIEVVRLNGTSRKVLINQDLKEPRAIVLDPMQGYMFWSDWGKDPKIERAAMDGSNRIVIVNTSLGWPNGLAIDYDGSRIYWADAFIDIIELCDYNGGDRRSLVTEQIPHIFGISLLGDYVYWADWQMRSIGRVHKVNGSQQEIVIEQLADLMGLKAVPMNGAMGTNLCAKNNGGCSHLCLNRPNDDYVCVCPMWMELAADQKTCIVPEAFLLFARREDIRRVSLENHHNNVVIPLSGVKNATALDFDINDNRIYWIDNGIKSICRAFMNGSNLERVIDIGLEYPEGMAVDWVARNIYWTDDGLKRIEVARLNGSSRKILVWKDMGSPRTLTLDPSFGNMYWSDWGIDRFHIERAALDGSMRVVFMKNVGRVAGLTLDYEAKRIYWVNIDSKVIESSDLQGGGRTSILSKSLAVPYGLTQYQDYIYWTDLEAKSIEKANKTNGNNKAVIESDVEDVMDILVFHASRQSGWNPCSMSNGGCSHLCLALPFVSGQRVNNYTCSCPTHYTFVPENKTCEAPSNFMLMSQKNQLIRLAFDSDDAPDVFLPVPNLKMVRSISYDFVERKIYWIDGKSNVIRKINESGSGMAVVVPNSINSIIPFDLVVDPYSRLIFWSCEKTNVINATRMDSTHVGVIVESTNIQEQRPRSIAVHLLKGYLFWVNAVKEVRIERAALDGSKRLTLFKDQLKSPNCLTVDESNDLIYWADEGLKQIFSASIEGGDRKVLSSDVKVISLSVYGNYLYFIDQDIISRLNVQATADGSQRLLRRYNKLVDLITVQIPTTQEFDRHACAHRNGGCSHLCLMERGVKRCSCPVHLVLKEDSLNCGEPPTCGPEYFACENKVDCIPKVWRCDGTPECNDKSDEMNCPTCHDKFRCRNGDCIDRQFVCDKTAHCQDGGDEEHCCETNEFMCVSNHQCIAASSICDHKPDCPDGSDEKLPACSSTSASESESKVPSYTIAIVAVTLMIIMFAVLVVVCRRRCYTATDYEECTDVMLPFEPLTSSTSLTPAAVAAGAPARMTGVAGWTGSGRGVGDGNSSEVAVQGRPFLLGASFNKLHSRSHVTGASSSSSSGAPHYPKETLNPPPSPVTEKSQYSATYGCPSHHQSYRHYRARNRPPPPTPCSTDVCDDSEPYAYRNCYDFGYEFDPYPPPPTPRSHYLSDDNYPNSCPPSPSTERSFYNPYPPPPSPEAPTDF